MKLDKIKFAQVVAYIGELKPELSIDVYALDNMIDVEVPEPSYHQPMIADINELMFLIAQGQRKIEAIKMHRKLTGLGLKESKDAVEAVWVSKSSEGVSLGDILYNAKRND